jgi:CRISPR-associated protein Csb1
VWESTGEVGGLGVKFSRAIVSEINGVGALVGRKTASRIDPLQIGSIPIYEAADGKGEGIPWTAEEARAVIEVNKPDESPTYKRYKVSNRAKGVPSEVNHSNITPDLARYRGDTLRLGRNLEGVTRVVRKFDELPGGVTFEHAQHTAVLSLAALRKLHFPLEESTDASPEARLVLAALGLFALTELRREGYDLRSRCVLVIDGNPSLEILTRDGSAQPFSLDQAGAETLLDGALRRAEEKGLVWRKSPVELRPSTALVGLVVRSRQIGTVEADGDEASEEDEANGTEN